MKNRIQAGLLLACILAITMASCSTVAGTATLTLESATATPASPSTRVSLTPAITLTYLTCESPGCGLAACLSTASEDFSQADNFGDGYIARAPVKDFAGKGPQDITAALVTQWLEHYKTQSTKASAAIKDYSLDSMTSIDTSCNPLWVTAASVGFSIVPAQVPNDYASFPGDIPPSGAMWRLVAPFGVFRDGNDYRLRLLFGWGT